MHWHIRKRSFLISYSGTVSYQNVCKSALHHNRFTETVGPIDQLKKNWQPSKSRHVLAPLYVGMLGHCTNFIIIISMQCKRCHIFLHISPCGLSAIRAPCMNSSTAFDDIWQEHVLRVQWRTVSDGSHTPGQNAQLLRTHEKTIHDSPGGSIS